jgi:restriction endonuclease Mrr
LGLDAYLSSSKKMGGKLLDVRKFRNLQELCRDREQRKEFSLQLENCSNDAVEYTKNIDAKIVLIDGNQLGRIYDLSII